MANSFRQFLKNADLNHQYVDYTWDDTDVTKGWNFDYANDYIEKLEKISLRAKLVLMIGVYEWVYARFESFPMPAIFSHMAEAAYCANINKFYLISHIALDNMNISRKDFIGPIDGALYCAGRMALLPTMYVSDNTTDIDDDSVELWEMDEDYDLERWKSKLPFLIAEVLHILPQDKVPLFKHWLEGVTNRLVEHYIMPEEDPFANLFGHKNDKEWLGDYVAREVLDLNYPYNPKDAVKLCDQFLQQVDYRNNPLLVPPEQLTGKIEHPYRLVE